MAESCDSAVSNSESSLDSWMFEQTLEPLDVLNRVVFKPILLEDYTYEDSPESLVNLLRSIELSDVSVSRIRIVVGLIHVLMLESGFVPPSYFGQKSCFCFDYRRVTELSGEAISWPMQHDDRQFVLKYVLQDFEQFQAKLVLVYNGEDLIVNCLVEGMDPKPMTALIDPLKYLISSNTNLSTVKFQQLRHLSRLFKDTIAYPVKVNILRNSAVLVPSFEHLPTEVLLIIIRKLYPGEKRRLMMVNTKFYHLLH